MVVPESVLIPFFDLLPGGMLVEYQDALLDKHIAEDAFGDQELQDMGRPIKSLLVGVFLPINEPTQMLFYSLFYYFVRCSRITNPTSSEQVVTSWACLLVFGVLKFLQWSSLLSSRKGIAFSAFGLALVTGLMQVLIRFSQSERSTPAKVAPAKQTNGGESSEAARQDKQH